jgi:methionyl aminopeptidase
MLILVRTASIPGCALIELEDIAAQYIYRNKLKGTFVGHHGYKHNLCLSVNDCLVHGIPDRYVLQAGDLLKIDAGITYK